MPAAAIGRVRIGFGPHRVVEIARVLAVDRDQREVAQIGAAVLGENRTGARAGRLGLGQRRRREFRRDVERGDRQPADRVRGAGRAEPFEDAGLLAEAARRLLLGDDQLAVGQPGRILRERRGTRSCRGDPPP